MKRLATILLCLFIFQSLGAQEKLIYREKVEQRISTIEVSRELNGNFPTIQIAMSYGVSCTVLNDSEQSTLSVKYTDKPNDTMYVATRLINVISIEGIFKGKPISKVLQIDSRPVYAYPEWSFQQFVVTGSIRKPIFFWFFVAEDAAVRLMTACGVGRETIDTSNGQMDADKIKMNLPGFASVYWSAFYWYRPSDGVFLRSEIKHDLSAPLTIVELIKDF